MWKTEKRVDNRRNWTKKKEQGSKTPAKSPNTSKKIEGEFSPQEWAETMPPIIPGCVPNWLRGLSLPSWVKSLRPWQVNAIESILKAYQDGFETVLLEAPTGAGKTLIAECVRQLLIQGPDEGTPPRPARACYICTTKSLQAQFIKDFPYSTLIKGRANYPTHNVPELFNPEGIDEKGERTTAAREASVSCSECNYKKGQGCNWCSIAQDMDQQTGMVRNSCFGRCPYVIMKDRAQVSDLSVLNTSYFMAVCAMGSTDIGDGFGFGGRELAIFDEGDLLESQIMGQYEITIPKRDMLKLEIPAPPRKTVAKTWPEWIRVEAMGAYKRRLMKIKIDKSMKEQARAKKIKSTEYKLERLSLVAEEIEADPEAWVYDGYKQGGVTFKPVRVDKYGKELLWQYAHKKLIMSATFLTPKGFAKNIGLDPNKVKFVKVPSSFPVQHRPIILRKVAKNTYKERDEAWARISKECLNICLDNPDKPALIHTVSYPFAKKIAQVLRRGLKGRRVLTYTDANGRDRMLKEFKKNPEGAVIVAPSFDRGVDLAGDLCRLQIVAKVPYPSLADKQVCARMYGHGGDEWYAAQTIRTIVQMTGRAIRKPNDWAWTYILDSMISRLIIEHRSLFPKWWLSSVVRDGFGGMSKQEAKKRNLKQ